MGLSPDALFAYLQCDLSRALPRLDLLFRESNFRGLAYPGISAREFAGLSLLDSVLKKFQDRVEVDADQRALAKFLKSNDACNRVVGIDRTAISEIEEVALGEMQRFIYNFCFPKGEDLLEIEDVLSGIDVGPGASVGARGQSFYNKIADSPMTATSESLYRLYKGYSDRFPLCAETEKIRSSRFGGVKVVAGNRLSFVPKSTTISRTICTEPLLNMMFQKGIGARLEAELARQVGIDLAVQPDKNRALARLGSETGRFGTIDLSSASDTIATCLVKELFPVSVYRWLMESRSPSVTLPNGEVRPLHMVSSMGNAFTFPLQTIIFSSVVIGVYRALDIECAFPRGKSLGNFAVFGDDIIVRREAYDLVVRILQRCGFEVNLDKSYNEGAFRESCGSDFWNGSDVRGVYLQSLKTQQDVYSAINRLMVWMSNHDIFLPSVMSYLVREGKANFLPVPPHESDVAGIKVPLSLVSDDLKRDRNRSIVYRRFLPRANSYDLRSVGAVSEDKRQQFRLLENLKKLKRYRVNENAPGILLTAIGGYLRDGQVSIRSRGPVYYQKRLATTPCWDSYDPCQSKFTADGWHRWKNIYVGLVFWKD